MIARIVVSVLMVLVMILGFVAFRERYTSGRVVDGEGERSWELGVGCGMGW
jgi:hypothetical protein